MLVVYFYPTDLRVKRVDKCDWKSAGDSIKLGTSQHSEHQDEKKPFNMADC